MQANVIQVIMLVTTRWRFVEDPVGPVANYEATIRMTTEYW